ncbi:MAG: hypothetical protein IBJ04_01735 [Hydrogenophaga sp.]|uniref:calcium-binding protein n=1 Tax=Hydrogenophaga sp. TaxID=1904254 RepID=UPI00257D02FC|nr:calcium-binding protein [Hydrogenophaga sp.]MBL0943036.1 hypothetical protein [Hydrogenophaga sp.]
MSKTQALTTAQLAAYAQQLANGTLTDVKQVYADLYSKGYNYAGWAGGVASESTITGVSAVNFLTGTAMMGWGGPLCRNLSDATLDSIRMGMAKGYVDVLIKNADDNDGVLSTDLNYRDTKQLHQKVFADHNLSLDNWTLNTPMELVRQTQGDEAVEALWREIRDTGGDGLDGTLASVKLYNTVGRLSFSEDPAIRDAALDWIEQVPGFANWDAIGRSAKTLMEWLEHTEAGRMLNAIHRVIDSDPFFLANPLTNTSFNAARAFIVQRDPLVLDLDGDGLELTGASGNVLFDHNADGIRTGTGWARADDGFLVRDLNGNGRIDSGRELFGVDTVKRNGQFASQGFDALADLDANGDGQVTSADAAWAQLQVWRDANQDGISQSSELSKLDALGITRISLNGSSSGPQAGQTLNNNRVALSTSFTRNGVNRTVGAIDLEANGFFSEIPPEVVDEQGNPVVIGDAAQALPQMNGSGMVRNLRAAMSQSGAQASELQAAVAAFAAATTREQQRALVDTVITEWAQTSSYWSSLEGYLGGSVALTPPAGMTAAQYRNMIGVLEAFNGSRFYGTVGSAMPVGESGSTVNGVTSYAIGPAAQQAALLQQAYQGLKESVYGALVMQTRLKPYLDAVALNIDDTGVHVDLSGLGALVQQRAAQDATQAVADVLDLGRYGQQALQGLGWSFENTMADVLGSVGITPEITALLTAEKVAWIGSGTTAYTVGAAQAGFTVIGNDGANTLTGHAAGSERLMGGRGNDSLNAVGNNDVLEGGEGDDVLNANGNQGTTHIGGTGNDTLNGSFMADTYVFNRGDGADTIGDYGYHSNDVAYQDKLVFGEGIRPADVGARREGDHLVLRIAGSEGDRVTVKNWFSEASGYYRIEQLTFADGTRWSHADLAQLALTTTNTGTTGNDTLWGTPFYSDRLVGGAGNDTLNAIGSNDVLDGGEGDDVLNANGNQGSTHIGGQGNDTLNGSFMADTYVFNRGDGADTIGDYGYPSNDVAYQDRLVLGEGIRPADIAARREGDNLVLRIAGSEGDRVTVKNWFSEASGYYRIEQLAFADGTRWSHADLAQLALTTTNTGTTGNDTLSGTPFYSDRLVGGAGNDTLNAIGSNDVLDGGEGDDVLNANGNQGTTHIGGQGNDTLNGSFMADTYVFNRSDGADTINDNGYPSMDAAYKDRLLFGEGITEEDLWFSRTGNDLRIQVIGDDGQVQIKDWYSNPGCRLEELQLSEGQRLLYAKVDQMVQAMAAWSPPPPAQTAFTPEQQSALAPVIAASWG